MGARPTIASARGVDGRNRLWRQRLRSILCGHENGHVSTWLSGVAPFMSLGGEWSLDTYCERIEAP
ncbi:MAG: hypothetical protein IAG13_04780 [Deltaproteobacteria bacterium]|nr:hypothetical protein [Nannocystaceae bacterium]